MVCDSTIVGVIKLRQWGFNIAEVNHQKEVILYKTRTKIAPIINEKTIIWYQSYVLVGVEPNKDETSSDSREHM